MAMNLLDDYIIIEKGLTANQSHRVYQLKCRKSGKQSFVFASMYAGKTPHTIAKNAKNILYPINNVSTFTDALKAVEIYANKMPKIWSHEKDDPDTAKSNKDLFKVIDSYITCHLEIPVDILDIGAGYAWIDGLLQEKYDSNLYLLDGDSSKNDSSQQRDGGYGESNSFQFYREKWDLIKAYDERGLRYNFIDAQNLQIPPICFSLIISLTSCGFHYPLSTYSELIKKHSGTKTSVIVDLRAASAEQQLRETGFDLVTVLKKDESSILAHIQPSTY